MLTCQTFRDGDGLPCTGKPLDVCRTCFHPFHLITSSYSSDRMASRFEVGQWTWPGCWSAGSVEVRWRWTSSRGTCVRRWRPPPTRYDGEPDPARPPTRWRKWFNRHQHNMAFFEATTSWPFSRPPHPPKGNIPEKQFVNTYLISFSPLILLANAMSFGMIVTRFAWIAHKFVSSNSLIK